MNNTQPARLEVGNPEHIAMVKELERKKGYYREMDYQHTGDRTYNVTLSGTAIVCLERDISITASSIDELKSKIKTLQKDEGFLAATIDNVDELDICCIPRVDWIEDELGNQVEI